MGRGEKNERASERENRERTERERERGEGGGFLRSRQNSNADFIDDSYLML